MQKKDNTRIFFFKKKFCNYILQSSKKINLVGVNFVSRPQIRQIHQKCLQKLFRLRYLIEILSSKIISKFGIR